MLISSTPEIGMRAVDLSVAQFREENNNQDWSMLKHIPRLITDDENEAKGRMPDTDEVKKVVFDLSGDSVAGPDGFIGNFFQKC